jgi:hypothetical protein
MTFGFGFGFPRDILCSNGGSGGGPTLDLNFLSGTLPSTVTFTRSSTATYFNSAGVLTSAAIDVPRFDYNPATLAIRGLLIEEQRVNSIRNNMMVNAVAGTPGTLPTNWGNVLAGLTQTIVGTGVENGITYIDIRLNGTTTGTSAGIRFETNTGIAATSGQTWTVSTFCRLVGGSTANVITLNLGISGLTAGGAGTTDSGTVSLLSVVNMTNLATTRLSRGFTFADATTAFARVQVIVSFLVGAAIDITLRIGMPQFEQGGFATSVIPTSLATATRAPDIATMTGTNFSSWYNQSEGTLFAQRIQASSDLVNARRVVSVSDGTASNRIEIYQAGSGTTGANSVLAGVSDFNPSITGVPTAGSTVKAALAYSSAGKALTRDGLSVVTSLTVPPLSGILQMNIGGIVSNLAAATYDGYIQRIAYYPRRLSNAELQAITA